MVVWNSCSYYLGLGNALRSAALSPSPESMPNADVIRNINIYNK